MQIIYNVDWQELGALYGLSEREIANLMEYEGYIEEACIEAITDQLWQSIEDFKEGVIEDGE